MPIALNIKTRNIPLQFAQQLSLVVNKEWKDGTLLEKVTPVTKDLLKFWFQEPFTDRSINFHEGQKQAILNTIYCHEVLKSQYPLDLYQQISTGLLNADMLMELNNEKNKHPKYCIKMATGTGKTWVLNALLAWQYLNAKYLLHNASSRYSKNFLLIAPGIIVYERLLDTLLGKEQIDGRRDFTTADLKRHERLFVPEKYRQTLFSFIQNSVVKKEEIGKKITGEGIIAITNWHQIKEEEEAPLITNDSLRDPSVALNELLPLKPGTSTGHALDNLDSRYLNGDKLEFLSSLPNLCVFNDEAHHIHTNKTAGVREEVEWQKTLNRLSEKLQDNFFQIDFSATPYNVTGSGHRRTKHYFSHIIVNFDLPTAIHQGLVKIITIDKRNELTSLDSESIDFKAKRDGKKVLALSEGQCLMLRAGLKKLKILEESFTSLDGNKHPKMLVICEDTSVAPLVVDFLHLEGLSEGEVCRIDSNKKGEVTDDEWKKIKKQLFNIDKQSSPKVIVSVLMLREGFDVNNICVVVPLRSSNSAVLLEQVIGRGLRLMWREPEYQELKNENLNKILHKKEEPKNYLDILSIVEHPAFIKFYEDLQDGLVVEEREGIDRGSILGDMINVGLKDNFKQYDLFFPHIVKDRSEFIKPEEIIMEWKPFSLFTLEQLQGFIGNNSDEIFHSEEMTVKTRFGEYRVSSNLFTAQSYNEFLVKLLSSITSNLRKIGSGNRQKFPVMTINIVHLLKMLDRYIRHDLFCQDFNPLQGNNWKVLMLAEKGITTHIMQQVSQVIYNMQHNVTMDDAIIQKHWFSSVSNLKMRENFSLNIQKSIYTKTKYPSNKGEFEKEFLLFADKDTAVERLIKIDENYHSFASLYYIRTDGLISSYFPDFMVKFAEDIFLIETKATEAASNANVQQKQKSALDWCRQINQVRAEDRMSCRWHYSLLDENTFKRLQENGVGLLQILQYAELTYNSVKNTLFDIE